MTTPVKVGLGIGGLALLYFGFIHKDKNGFTAFQKLTAKKIPNRTVDSGVEEKLNADATVRGVTPAGSTSRTKWKEPFKSSGGTMSCPKGYELVNTPDGKFCRLINA